MEKKSVQEFDCFLEQDGTIAVPREIAERFSGSKLHVLLERKEISDRLKKNNVTEGEIERISALQLETREQVIKFLLSQGTLAKRASNGRRRKEAAL
ncbi:MAG: hypothetical protein KF749_14055 [Bacteroidetes bacterium]|nr:hypothetical protein [Bacteroidota bacterium]MCW5895241.1 hypothetical protein [Bacteroidota bacterium]